MERDAKLKISITLTKDEAEVNSLAFGNEEQMVTCPEC
jgi:hypothetical protein